MSAFVCSNETFNAVVSAFDRFHQATGAHGARTAECHNALGDELFALNAEAVGQRYSETRETREPFQFNPATEYTDAVMLAAVNCLKYQCSEGDVPERPLFNRLVALSAWLGQFVNKDSDEYENAPWDLPEPSPAA